MPTRTCVPCSLSEGKTLPFLLVITGRPPASPSSGLHTHAHTRHSHIHTACTQTPNRHIYTQKHTQVQNTNTHTRTFHTPPDGAESEWSAPVEGGGGLGRGAPSPLQLHPGGPRPAAAATRGRGGSHGGRNIRRRGSTHMHEDSAKTQIYASIPSFHIHSLHTKLHPNYLGFVTRAS